MVLSDHLWVSDSSIQQAAVHSSAKVVKTNNKSCAVDTPGWEKVIHPQERLRGCKLRQSMVSLDGDLRDWDDAMVFLKSVLQISQLKVQSISSGINKGP